MRREGRVQPLAATAAYPGHGLNGAVVALRLAVVGLLPLPLPRVAAVTRAGAGGDDPVVVDSAVVAACAVALSLRTPQSRRMDRFEVTFQLGSQCRDLALAERLARVGALAPRYIHPSARGWSSRVRHWSSARPCCG